MNVKVFFDEETSTFSYVATDVETKKSAVIDPVLNFDITSGRTTTRSADEIISYIKENNFELEWILETHAHADHLSSAKYIKNKLGGKVAIGEHISSVVDFWAPIYNIDKSSDEITKAFDHFFADNEKFKIGNQEVEVMHTPGHTPACVTYVMGENAFVGDTIFMPYVGTARTDFPGGSAKTLYRSIQRILSLPTGTKLYTCHDYPPKNSKPECLSTVDEQLNSNSMINKNVDEYDFINARNVKDKNKSVPKLLLPAIQVNILGGCFQQAEENGIQYIKIPVNQI